MTVEVFNMKQMFVYTAIATHSTGVDVLNGHVTTSFTPLNGDTPKLKTQNTRAEVAYVSRVEYFPKADVTVALVESETAWEDYDYYQRIGFTYDHEFRPHITLRKGDCVKEYEHLAGELVVMGEAYIGFLELNK